MEEQKVFSCKVECVNCGRQFTVPNIATPLPNHPGPGELAEPGNPIIPCPGSGMAGFPVDPAV